ncbi:hypothetical protein EDF88_3924 [Buttiauxella sp. BIGb0552]|uniref:hypothetical protein n=1 Tax=Buttiauxella sp. BIGb0552 TaxID=2485120 RepID=UPI001064DCC0|nr:hypothetical protein [Buttiauxella sp. BIGb0552]TDX14607.1 hypothetical protein EDF88_3924 [Buttiauxella sp. BIGb0552]
MALFTVRIELRGADWETYNRLHESMNTVGYYRRVTGDNGVIFQLPDAEYAAEKNATVQQVHDEVLRIANQHNIDPHVLVSETVRWAWTLPKA